MSDSVQEWRSAKRSGLLAKRATIPSGVRADYQDIIRESIRSNFPELQQESVGFYWPYKGEVDLRPLVSALIADGADAALPVVVEKDQPLEFWEWRPDTRMSRGVWNIPIPKERKVVQPSLLLIPLLGFDSQGYRLGYGGGYYDRTLAALRLKPLTIGIGYEAGRLETIQPQPHDVPLDAIVTESGFTRFETQNPGNSAASSPPCYLHEFDDPSNPK